MKRRSLYISVATGPLVLLAIWVLGEGGESQFSPDSFQHRQATYCYVPFTDKVVFSFAHSPYRHILVQYWVNEGYLEEYPGEPKRWDSITGWKRISQDFSGPAKVFWYQAGCRSKEEARQWIEWSVLHPEFAKVLWPTIIELLREGKFISYHLAAHLMILVRGNHDLRSFEDNYGKWRLYAESVRTEFRDSGVP